jgi:hypothetical protein
VEDARHLVHGWRPDILEAQAAERRGESLSVLATYQQVEVAVASSRALE